MNLILKKTIKNNYKIKKIVILITIMNTQQINKIKNKKRKLIQFMLKKKLAN